MLTALTQAPHRCNEMCAKSSGNPLCTIAGLYVTFKAASCTLLHSCGKISTKLHLKVLISMNVAAPEGADRGEPLSLRVQDCSSECQLVLHYYEVMDTLASADEQIRSYEARYRHV